MPYVIDVSRLNCDPSELSHKPQAIWPVLGDPREVVKFVPGQMGKGAFATQMRRAVETCYPGDQGEQLLAALEFLIERAGMADESEIYARFTVNCQGTYRTQHGEMFCQKRAGHNGGCGPDSDSFLGGP